MRDYEELVRRLKICPDYNDGCKNCPREHDLGCRSTTMREAADAIEELSLVCRTQKAAFDAYIGKTPKWISVEEKLPDKADGDWVIGVVNGKIGNVTYIDSVAMVTFDPCEKVWFLDEDPFVSVKVAHWMPLPEPPEEEK